MTLPVSGSEIAITRLLHTEKSFRFFTSMARPRAVTASESGFLETVAVFVSISTISFVSSIFRRSCPCRRLARTQVYRARDRVTTVPASRRWRWGSDVPLNVNTRPDTAS